jgi:hypothetical protein
VVCRPPASGSPSGRRSWLLDAPKITTAEGLCARAIMAPCCSAACSAPVRGSGAHRWALFGRIHAGGDGCRTARECVCAFATKTLQNLGRRASGRQQTAARDDHSLLQGVLAGDDSVRKDVGKGYPGRPGWEFPAILPAGLLVLAVALQVVVEVQHETVVGRAPREQLRQAPSMRHPRPARGHAVLAGQRPERIRGEPHARTVGVDVDECPQDEITPVGRVGNASMCRRSLRLLKLKFLPSSSTARELA